MIQFLIYNKLKILRIAVIAFVLLGFVLLIAKWQSGSQLSISWSWLVNVVYLTLITTIVITVLGALKFRSVLRLVHEGSSTSLLPLFEDGYTVQLTNADSRFFFTGERLRASISGLPVSVDFSKEVRTKRQIIVFSFYPLRNAQTGEKAMYSTSFYAGIRHTLFRDIKPEVLKFVEDLKNKGYVAYDDAE